MGGNGCSEYRHRRQPGDKSHQGGAEPGHGGIPLRVSRESLISLADRREPIIRAPVQHQLGCPAQHLDELRRDAAPLAGLPIARGPRQPSGQQRNADLG